jgi:hypothetical protein
MPTSLRAHPPPELPPLRRRRVPRGGEVVGSCCSAVPLSTNGVAKPGAKMVGVAHSNADLSMSVVVISNLAVLWNLFRC